MSKSDVIVTRAHPSDLEGILALQADNQVARGGSLAASLPAGRIVSMMAAMPQIVARSNGQLTGFLMTTTREMNADLAIVQAMLAAYPGSPDAYVYGPICVSEHARGQGLAQQMFAELCRLEPGREGMLFIRNDNAASIRAHLKMGMREVASFPFNGADYAVFTFTG
jgi:predicted GNAT superfamily acetyltransferase